MVSSAVTLAADLTRVDASGARYAYEAVPDEILESAAGTEPSFVVVGDVGEGDTSQYALLAALDELDAPSTLWSSAAT